jgi:hypothetical protein
MKLAYSADGNRTVITADANGLEVQLGTSIPAGTNNIGDVDVLTCALPTGAATEATLTSVKTAVEVIDNAIAGTEMQVDVVGALPAGTNAIGKLAANSGVDIGDVDVLSMPGVAAEASALGSGMLIQGDDGTDRTNVLVDTDGHLQVDVLSGGTSGTQYTEGDTDATITGTAVMWEDTGDALRAVSAAKPLPVNIVAGAGSGGTAAADDADFTAGTTSGTPAMGVYESSPSSVTDGDLGTVGITAGRRLKTSAVVEGTVPVSDGGGALTVDGTVGISGSVTVVGGAVFSVDDGGGALTVDGTVTAELSAVDNAVLDAIAASVGTLDNAIAGTEMQVDVVAALPAGTNAIGKLAANSGVDIGDVDVASIQLANGKTRVSKRVALSASQTGATVWDPTGGTRFVLKKLVVSCATGGTVQFFDGTDSGNTVIGPILSLADDGGYAENWDGDMPYVSAAADNILKYTTDETFVGSVCVEGWEV